MTETPRGIRNHNPGNIRRSADPWQGLADEQTDPDFFNFRAPAWGIRAMARLLITYQEKHGLRTIEKMLHRWTPPIGYDKGRYYEQNTESAIRNISMLAGFPPDLPLDFQHYDQLEAFVKALITQENGMQPYPQSVIDRGLELAGVVPAKRKAISSPEGQAGAVAGSVAGGVALTDILSNAQPALPVISSLAENAPWILAAGLAVAVAWFLYQRREK